MSLKSEYDVAKGMLIGCALVIAVGRAHAQIPNTGARASVEVQSAGNEIPDQEATGLLFAETSAELFEPDTATAAAEATVLGDLKSRALAGGASGQQGPFRGHAESQWVAQLQAVGVDPGAPIDVDVSFSVDGNLTFLNNNSGAGPGDLISAVSFQLSVHDSGGETELWNGDAALSSIEGSSAPELTRNFDWADAARDGDFDTTTLSNVGVNTSVTLDDAFTVDFGEVFAIDAELVATAFAFAGFEAEAGANFFDTGSVTISTGTPGVSLVPVIPEPQALTILCLSILAALATRGRTPT